MIKYAVLIIVLFISPAWAFSLFDDSSSVETNPIDSIIVEKSKRKLSVYSGSKILKTYNIALGFSPTGHKLKERDGKTPEGQYYITDKNPHSQFYLSLKISYPNEKDLQTAKRLKVHPGKDIVIHGAPNRLSFLVKIPGINWFIQRKDWTKGCISLTNSDMEELYDTIPVGTKIIILP